MKSKRNRPPLIFEWLVKMFFPDRGSYSTVGDMHEQYSYINSTDGLFAAKWWYTKEVFKSIIPLFTHSIYWGIEMFLNYIKLAWRNFTRQKTNSFINLTGLTLGIASSIIILLFTLDELSFDKFNSKYDRIGRIITEEFQNNGESRFYPLTSGMVGKTLVQEYPEVEKHVNIIDRDVFGRFVVQRGEFQHHEADYLMTEPAFFEIFDYEMLIGNKSKVLHEPNEVVLTSTSAQLFFGDEDPIGEVLQTNRPFGNVKVVGVMNDPPGNSHLQFSMLISMSSLLTDNSNFTRIVSNWDISSMRTYLLFNSESSLNRFDGKLKQFDEKHATDVFGVKESAHIQKMENIHFGSTNYEIDRNYGARSINAVYILGIIGLFIVLSACINYSNLSIARYFNRAKEIGVRKVVGANKQQVLAQIFSESVFISVLAVLVSVGVVYLVLPTFNNYLDKNLTGISDNSLLFFGLIFFITLFVGMISGSLPAFFLSKLKTVSLMRLKLMPGNSVSVIKKSLVVLQFVISTVMIFATITVYNQLNFIKNKDLGFDQGQMLVVDINSRESRNNFQSIKNEFLNNPAVSSVTVSSRVPGDWKDFREIQVANFGQHESENIQMNFICVDEDFLNTFNISMREGSYFKGNPGLDSTKVVVNREVLRSLNISEPIGKIIQVTRRGNVYPVEIIGVVDDFNFRSLHQKVGPMVIGYYNSPFDAIDYYSLKVNMAGISETIKQLKAVHEKFDKGTPFEYNFLDEKIAEFYQRDVKESTIINSASLISILIACLGLFGLASYTAQQKVKEIGIRKVLGARDTEIVVFFSKGFLMLVAIAMLIAIPLGYHFMDQWLEGFAYRIDIGFSQVLFSAVAAILISVITISYQAIKASNNNPVDSIRAE